MTTPLYQIARERVEGDRLRHIGDDDLVRVVLEKDVTLAAPISTLAWSSPHELATLLRISRAKAARLAAVFELGRRDEGGEARDIREHEDPVFCMASHTHETPPDEVRERAGKALRRRVPGPGH